MQVLQVNIEIIKKRLKIITVILLNLMFVFSGFICAKSTGEKKNDRLPDARPEKISISLSVSGGMMYYFELLFISPDSCYYTVNNGGAVSRINFKMQSAELDKLYEVFKDNEFDRIETYEEMIYDRGGESIQLSWGKGKYASVSNSGISLIEKSWQKEWSACENALGKIIEEQKNKQKKNYEIKIDKSFFGKDLYLQLDMETIFPKGIVKSENPADEYIIKTVSLMPGSHRVSFSLDNIYRYNAININTDSSNGIKFSVANDTLVEHTFSK